MMINLIIFLLISIFLLFKFLSNPVGDGFIQQIPKDLWLSASSDISVMIRRPWSLFTHMFAHIQFGHFLFNMVALYTMGQVFVSVQGFKKLTAVYIMGGLAGYLLFALSFNFLDVFKAKYGSYVLGASAAVMAITVAAATLRPKQILYLFGAVKLELMWLAAILVLLDLASVPSGVNSGGHIGHIGGAAFGYIYARQIQKGNDMGRWFNNFLDKIKSLFAPRKMKVASNNARPKSDEVFNLEKKARQKKIDAILDKIGKSGYDSLSKDEKDFLFRNSQK